MDVDELRRRLGAILSEEEREVVDWTTVSAMLDELAADVKGSEFPHFVHHFISDSDIRAKDPVYGQDQRQEVRRFVDTGGYDPDWDKEIRPWGCIAAVVGIGGLMFWLM